MSAFEHPTVSPPFAVARVRARVAPVGWWRILIPLYLGLAASSASLHAVLQPGAWWPLALLMTALILGAAAAVRRFGVHPLLGTAAGALVGIGMMTLVFGQSTAFLGFLPTLNTFGLFGEVVRQGAQEIYSQAAPAVAVPEIVFLVVGGMAVVAVLQDLLAFVLRVPALCGVVFLTLVAIPGGVVVGQFDIPAFVVIAAIYFWLLRADVRVRELDEMPEFRSAVRRDEADDSRVGVGLRGAGLAAVAIVASLVLPNVIPALTEAGFAGSGPTGGGTSSGRVNPILSLGDDLRRPGNIDALSYATETDEALYFKLTTLSRFTGRTWAPSRTTADDSNTVDDIATAPGRSDSFPTTEVTVNVDVQGSNTRWLPAPYPATSVEGLDGDWYWEPDGLTISTSNSSTRGQDYRITSELAAPTREQLAATRTELTPYLERNLELPERFPDVIANTALEVTAEAGNDYERALALQDFFRSGDFRYSEQAPVEDDYDGNGTDVIARFLEEKAGYCVHFSSSMAVMARSLGIPARIAVGYLPGSRSGSDGDLTVYQVGTQDLHAWPELYFEGAGWLKFEPTPGRGDLAEYASPAPIETTAPDQEPNAPTPAPAVTTPPPGVPGQDLDEAGAPTTVDTSGGPTALVVSGVALVLLFVPAGWRVVLRARRRAALRSGRAPASLAWREVQDTARDFGIPVRSTDTPRAFAERIAALPGIRPAVREAIDGIRAAFERERFAAAEDAPRTAASGAQLADWADEVSVELSARGSWAERLRASLAPVSVLSARRRARRRPVPVGRAT